MLLFCTSVWGGLNGTEWKKGAEDEISFGSSTFVRYKSDCSTVRWSSCNFDDLIDIKMNSEVTSITSSGNIAGNGCIWGRKISSRQIQIYQIDITIKLIYKLKLKFRNSMLHWILARYFLLNIIYINLKNSLCRDFCNI